MLGSNFCNKIEDAVSAMNSITMKLKQRGFLYSDRLLHTFPIFCWMRTGPQSAALGCGLWYSIPLAPPDFKNFLWSRAALTLVPDYLGDPYSQCFPSSSTSFL